MILETVRVVNPSSGDGMLINIQDFDASIHKLFKPIPNAIKSVSVDVVMMDMPEAETTSAQEEYVSATKKGRPFSKK